MFTLLLLFSSSLSLQAQRAMEDLPSASSHASLKSADTTWLPGWMMVEDYDVFVPEWDTTELHHYTYSGAGFATADSVDQWAFGMWNPTTKWEYTTDGEGEVLWTTRLIRVAGSWMYDYSLQWSNDSLGNRLGFLWLDWNPGLGAWDTMLVRRFVNTYDGSGHLLEQINQTKGTSGWDNSSKTIWAYSTAGQDTLEERYSWSSAMWMPSQRYVKRYNASGEMTDLFWSSGSGTAWEPQQHEYAFTWRDFSKYQYFTRTVAAWTGSAYEDIERYTVTYGSFDSQVSVMEVPGASGWEPSMQTTYSYDATGRQTLHEQSNWDGAAFVPNLGTMHLYTYGPGGELLVDEYQMLMASPTYVPQQRLTYGNHSVDAPQPAADAELRLWPNPAQGLLHVSLPAGSWNLRLFSLLGQEVALPLHQQEGAVEVPLEQLRAGTYLMQAQRGNLVITKKLIVH